MVPCTRRSFVAQSLSCAAHLSIAAAWMPAAARAAWARQGGTSTIAREPFGTLEQVADGIWALISTPLEGDRTTLANGGIIAGTDAVLAVEGFYQPAGARWLAGKAQELTRMWPSQIILTHYHADHVNGVGGYLAEQMAPYVRATARTRDLARERNAADDPALAAELDRVTVLPPTSQTLDLGGRIVRITALQGHTESDVTVEVADPHVVFCGDLVWNGMFPNFVDATPSALRRAVRSLRGDGRTVYVPGHGPLARAPELDRYAAMLDAVEDGARRAHGAGTPAADAAAAFTLPTGLGEWTLFGRTFYERAFTAWYRELAG